MALVKCPRCELNYILDGDKFCTICRREVRGEITEPDDLPELCSECGEVPAIPGSEFCTSCLKEMTRRVSPVSMDDNLDVIAVEDTTLEIDSVSAMDEIQIDIADDLDDDVFESEESPFTDEDDESDEDEDGDLFDS